MTMRIKATVTGLASRDPGQREVTFTLNTNRARYSADQFSLLMGNTEAGNYTLGQQVQIYVSLNPTEHGHIEGSGNTITPINVNN